MLTYSNNFMANQILVSLGAARCGPPGTLDKGVSVLHRYCIEVLGTKGIHLVEGSGISRENQLTALDMLTVLKAFSNYRHLMTQQGDIRFKSGTLRGIQTRAGYFEPPGKGPHPFVISLKDSGLDIDRVMKTLASSLCASPTSP
jgi:D-alanyl-D-alanine carboxypeptidase/D-alanyl-D-alanine-endopeptidase (penicillin-binding protein 4)